MKNYLFAVLAGTLCWLSSCKKDSGNSGSPITDSQGAKGAFIQLNGLWTGTLKPLLSKTPAKFTDLLLSDSAGGSATVNGSYTSTSYTGSSGSTSSKAVDAIVLFKGYRTKGGMRLDGTIHFYDGYSFRMDCGSSGCASATHTSVAYRSEDGSGNTLGPTAVVFDYNGARYSDKILVNASKPYSTFSVIITNGQGKEFSFSY